MTDFWIWVAGGFFLGLASAGHCLGMCGPLAVFLGTRLGGEGATHTQRFALQFVMGTGKAFTYAVIGLVFGFAGTLLASWSQWMGFSHAIPIIFGILMIILGISCLGFLPSFEVRMKVLERFRLNETRSSFLTGILWGFLPCPMVLVPALSAAVSGGVGGPEGAVRGFFMMFAFGLGTFPAIISSGILGSVIQFDLRRWSRFLAGFFLIGLGIRLLIR